MNNYSSETILYCKTGSMLYGTNTPQSDEDFVSVFIPKIEHILGLNKVEQVLLSTKKSSEKRQNTEEDSDHTAYTLDRFIKLLFKSNINMLELLFVYEPIYYTPTFIQIQDLSKYIISKHIFRTFMGYAHSQHMLLDTKTRRLSALNKGIELLNSFDNEYLVEDQALVLTESQSTYRHNNSYRTYHKGLSVNKIKSELQRDIDDYGHRKENIEKYGYESKFGSHVVRILSEGIELASTGTIEYPLKNAQEIIDVKLGKIEYDVLNNRIEELKTQFRELEKTTTLREDPDFNIINDFLIKTYKGKIT